jgi:hypothetical protein
MPYSLLNSFTAGLAILEDTLASGICGMLIKLHSTATLTYIQHLEKLLI